MGGHELSVRASALSDDGSSARVTVQVREGTSETHHEVTVGKALLDRLAPGEAPAAFVRRCFEFLLEREPKESILRRFDASVIGRYFPEFEKTIARRG